MSLLEFFGNVFFENIIIYFICLIGVCITLYPLHKKFVNGIFDPLFFQIWMGAFAYVIPIFLFVTDNISWVHFSYFIISESLFWIGFWLVSKKNTNFSKIQIVNEANIAKYTFYLALFIYLFSTLYTYVFIGIPLFISNRNDIYKDAGGLGLLSHLINFSSLYILIYSFYQYSDNNKSKYKWIIIIVAINCILSGGKSAILSIVYCFFYYSFFLKGKKPIIKKKYISIVATFPLIILLLSSISSDLTTSFLDLGKRLVANGDIYWCAYPNNIIDDINIKNPLSHLFIGFLGPLRLVSYENTELLNPIGLLINWEVYPDLMKMGITTAPNSRMAVSGWVYFGWSGILFSFILGCIVSFIIYRLPKYIPGGIIGVSFYSMIYFSALTVITDPGLAITFFLDCFLNMMLYIPFIFIFSKLKISYYKETT